MPKNVLIIDDNRAMQSALADIISTMFDANTFVADSPINGFSKMKNTKMHLIILDLEMPGMDGKTALTMIRRNKTSEELPVIMCSAVKNKQRITELLNLGVDDYLAKPFEMSTAVAKLSKFLTPQTVY
jgi:two-component system response regulator RegX3